MVRRSIFLFALAMLCSCHSNWHYVPLTFEEVEEPAAPNYGLEEMWASLPEKDDFADLVPSEEFTNLQDEASVDCFYIHPTGFLDKDKGWNADPYDEDINDWVDEWPLKHQASVFNGSCKVYAPRYRQAHMKSFFHVEEGGNEAIALAYTDVAMAFQYYLEHYNEGRPFIIASHSQGTVHGTQLIKHFIDGTPLQAQLVAAYLIGMPVKKDEFKEIAPCDNPADCGCFVSWITFDKGYVPEFYEDDYEDNCIINPITWNSSDEHFCDHTGHCGIVVSSYKLKYRKSISAKPHKGLLWVKKPKVPVVNLFVWTNIWHKADYNLFWVNIRENVADRCKAFEKSEKTEVSN